MLTARACIGLAFGFWFFVSPALAQPPANSEVKDLAAKLTSEKEGPAAADALARLQAESAAPVLAKALGSDYPVEVRWRAARALGTIGPNASEAVGALIANLTDTHERVRAYACYALGRIGGEAAQAAVPGLVERVTDENAVVRRAAIDALLAMRADRKILVPLMAKALGDAEPRIVMAAVHSLVSEGAAVVPVLTEAIENEKTAYWAAVALENLGPEAAPAVAPLTKLISHDEPEVRMQALMALAAIGKPAKPAAPQIVEHLKNDTFNGVRYAAAYALAKIDAGPQADAALTEVSRSDDLLLAMTAAWALANSHPDDAQLASRATDLIVSGLQSKDPTLQAAAARALAESNLASEITQPALEQAIATAPPQVVAHAMNAIAAQGKRAAPRVARALENEKLRKYAVKILAMIGPDAAEAAPALTKLLEEDDPEIKPEVQFALGSIGPAAAVAVPELIRSLASDAEEVQHSAIYALGRIGEQAKDACPELLKFLSRDDEFSQIAAVWALTRIDPGRPEIVESGLPILTRALESDRDVVRAEAAATLAEIGEPAKPVMGALRKALDDPSPAVRDAVNKAIQRIENGRQPTSKPPAQEMP